MVFNIPVPDWEILIGLLCGEERLLKTNTTTKGQMTNTPLRQMAETIVDNQEHIDFIKLYMVHPDCNWKKVQGACQLLIKT